MVRGTCVAVVWAAVAAWAQDGDCSSASGDRGLGVERRARVSVRGSAFGRVGRTNANLGTELDLNATVPITKCSAVAGAVFLPGGGSQSRGSSPSTWGFLSVRSQF